MKMNKKGFTLIEMLVVIAIIAVLVSIIIPIVSNSTTKAAAATDAANLRSAKATLTVLALEGTVSETTAATEVTSTLLKMDVPECKTNSALKMYYEYNEDTGVVVTFGTGDAAMKIADFVLIADPAETEAGG